jgi:predicted MarR family transcription regulator
MKLDRGYTQSPGRFRSLNAHLADLRDYERKLSRLVLISLGSLFAVAFLVWNAYDAYQLKLNACMESNINMNLAATEALVAMNVRSRELNELLSKDKVDVKSALEAVQDLRVATGVLRGHLFGAFKNGRADE